MCKTLYSILRPPKGGSAPVWPPAGIIFSFLSVFALSVHHAHLHLASLVFTPPCYHFFFSPVFMHQCVHLSITQSQAVINWFALRKSAFTFSAADYCQCILSSSVYVIMIDGVCVCVRVCLINDFRANLSSPFLLHGLSVRTHLHSCTSIFVRTWIDRMYYPPSFP